MCSHHKIHLCVPGQQHLTVQTVQSSSLQLGGVSASQGELQVEQALALEIQGQPGEKKRRMACTCPNCKDGEKRQVDVKSVLYCCLQWHCGSV